MDDNGLPMPLRPRGAAKTAVAEETPPSIARPPLAPPPTGSPDRWQRRLEIGLQVLFLVVVALLVGHGWETSRALDRVAVRLQAERSALEARERDQAERDRVIAASRDRVVRQQADLIASQEAVRQLTEQNLKLASELHRRLSGGD